MRTIIPVFLCFLSLQALSQADFRAPVELPFTGDGTLGDFADIDGDGDNDVVFSTARKPGLFVLYNDDGEFTRSETVIEPMGGSYINGDKVSGILPFDLYDMNGDDVSDIVVARWGDHGTEKISVFSYDDGQFEEIKTINIVLDNLFATQVEAGNISDDGKPDLMLNFQRNGNFVITLQTDDSGNYKSIQVNAPAIDVFRCHLADLDNDGISDIIAGGYRDKIAIIKNIEGKYETTQQLDAPDILSDFAIADFNGDERPDIISSSWASKFYYFVQDADGTFNKESDIDVLSLGLGLTSIDIDNDEDIDVVYTTQSLLTGTLINDGNGVFADQRNILNRDSPTAIAAGDVDGDNIPEVMPLGNAGHIEIFKKNGSAYDSYVNYRFSPTASDKGTLADLNKDGKIELILCHLEMRAITIASATGDERIFGTPTYFLTGDAYPSQAATGYFNDDEYPDVVYLGFNNAGDNVRGIIYGSPTGEYTHVINEPEFRSVQWLLHVADFNGDGLDDYLSNWLSISNGDGTFTAITLPGPANFSYYDQSAGDFDNDGKPDLVYTDGQKTAVMLNKGDYVFEEVGRYDTPNNYSVSTADVNGDDFDDIYYFNANDKKFVILLNNGDATFDFKTFDYNTGGASVFVADVDQDGVPELATLENNNGIGMNFYHVGTSGLPEIVDNIDLSDYLWSYQMLTGLINEDNKPDVVFTGSNTGASIMLSDVVTEPTIEPSDVIISDRTATSAKLSFTAGNGDGRIVIIHENAAVDTDPVDNTFYTANAKMGEGSQLGTGNYVVLAGNEVSITITGLKQGTQYYYSLMESDRNKTQVDYFESATTGSFTTKLSQTITFEIEDKTIGDNDFDLTATASSELPVTYEVISENVTISGSTVSIVERGVATIKAQQEGNDDFDAASIEKSFCVNPLKPTITQDVDNSGNRILLSSSKSDEQDHWYKNGNLITTANADFFQPTSDGAFTTTATFSTCTSESSDAFVYTGLEEKSTGISVSPNPTRGKLFITISDTEPVYPVIIDMTGRATVPGVTSRPGGLEVNVENLNWGLYYLQVRPGISYKFLKE